MLFIFPFIFWSFFFPFSIKKVFNLNRKQILALTNLTHATLISMSIFIDININHILFFSQSYFITDTIQYYIYNMKDKYIFTVHHLLCVICQQYAIYNASLTDRYLLYLTLTIAEMTNLPYLSLYTLFSFGIDKKRNIVFLLTLLQATAFLIIRPLFSGYVIYNLDQKLLTIPAILILAGSFYWGYKALRNIF